ncbi:MAG TPA: hypothetical protein VKP65_24675, partial [Rhodothermales bacterium]|nr:hypothetical protein [Rhodothermales bacterium]
AMNKNEFIYFESTLPLYSGIRIYIRRSLLTLSPSAHLPLPKKRIVLLVVKKLFHLLAFQRESAGLQQFPLYR